MVGALAPGADDYFIIGLKLFAADDTLAACQLMISG
jgi:hypothetical protein